MTNMTKQTEASSTERALKMALEALVKALPDMPVHTDWHLEAITALREALTSVPDWASEAKEQPAQQRHISYVCPQCFWSLDEKAAQQQEPFGHVTVRRLSQRFENHADQYWFFPAGQSPYRDNVDEIHAVYTSPPAQRKPWVGLTDAERAAIADEYQSSAAAALMVEAKLKEKNT